MTTQVICFKEILNNKLVWVVPDKMNELINKKHI